jgi:hypothetical protein
MTTLIGKVSFSIAFEKHFDLSVKYLKAFGKVENLALGSAFLKELDSEFWKAIHLEFLKESLKDVEKARSLDLHLEFC